jgi:endonuclease/exonuclease/phosphatase (EEP) superfamily protein YafD
MLTANLRFGNGDPASIVALVRAHHVDVLTTQELTSQEVDALTGAGLDALLPYHVTDARGGADGVGLWSRYPLRDPERLQTYLFAFVSAQVILPGLPGPVTVAAAHMPGPWPGPAGSWLDDIGKLPQTLRSLAARGAPVLLGGDFNATPDTAQFRRLLTGGYRDACEQAGAGLIGTWPAGTWYGPLIAIDHVLTYRAVGTAAKTVSVPRSDHRGLLVTVRIPTA